ncbi:MAG TPA: hypothetical protein PKA63_07170 [Oligoflexia bacterium]|nr:hypothetical protein [Oligoflexia bacterium]HMP48430.1 hypothetical protein [Oligoflexia bacterium]
MATNQSENLKALNDLDKTILDLEKGIKEIQSSVEENLKVFSVKNRQLEVVSRDLVAATLTHESEDKKLKEEEVKIVERRKQLTSLGGAKSAKLMERELDIAKRIMETLEQNVISALEKMDALSKQKDILLAQVDSLSAALRTEESEAKEKCSSAEKELVSLRSNRELLLKKLDERLQSLYKRVEKRYRGEAVAIAENGSCRSCFRALPAQTFNQVIAGYNLIQCPGCSRILIYLSTSEDNVLSGDNDPSSSAEDNSLTA